MGRPAAHISAAAAKICSNTRNINSVARYDTCCCIRPAARLQKPSGRTDLQQYQVSVKPPGGWVKEGACDGPIHTYVLFSPIGINIKDGPFDGKKCTSFMNLASLYLFVIIRTVLIPRVKWRDSRYSVQI